MCWGKCCQKSLNEREYGMELDICLLGSGRGELIVREGKGAVDRQLFEFNHNLETVLLLGIDKILERNKIRLTSFKKIRIEGKINLESLSYRIAQTLAKALKL